MAYRLELPEGVRIHPVLHCSVLKAFQGSPDSVPQVQLPPEAINGQPLVVPLAILDHHRSSTDVDAPWEVLVQWQGLSPNETSWEDWTQLCATHHLEDKVVFQGLGEC